MRVRTSAIALGTALVAASVFSGVLTMPTAHADDPLGPIRATVNGDRSRTGCPAYTYNAALEVAAQAYVRAAAGQGGYNGKTRMFLGFGDPQAAAINDAYKGGAGELISNCEYTEFGVGFIRAEDVEIDTVAIIFGAPASAAAQAPPPPASPSPQVPCPAGSITPTVPIGGVCVDAPPPTNQVSVSFAKGLMWTVTVKNASSIAGTCTFTSTGPGGGLSNKTFNIGANGSASFQVAPPLPFATYNVVTSCRGLFNGKDIEFGHNEQKVSL